ncbi:hypothetical protein J4E91_004754 [Alternaria rosae]|nr:hypothetical protein J4E91_004754 [Alternaria rosae]
MSSSSTNKVRLLTLFDVDSRKEWFNFLLTPSMTWNDMVVSIQAALKRHDQELWLHDRNGEPLLSTDSVFNFASIADREKLLVTTRENTRITSFVDLEVVLYLEEEDYSALQKTLQKTDIEEKRVHMEKLRRRDSIAWKNICRIVLPYSEVKKLLAKMNSVSQHKFKDAYSVANSMQMIRNNWRVRTTDQTKHLLKDPRCVAMIGIFSRALPGQHLLGEDFIIAAVKARIAAGGSFEPKRLIEQDILDAIQNLYKAADAIDSTWNDNKATKAINKRADRMEAYGSRKTGEAATALANTEAEDMGEEAAEAAYIGKGKVKAVDKLAGHLEKTKLPDNVMDDDEGYEDADDDSDSDYVD